MEHTTGQFVEIKKPVVGLFAENARSLNSRLGYKILRSHSPKEFCKALAIGTCLYQKSDSHQLNQCEYEYENANYDVGHTYGMI